MVVRRWRFAWAVSALFSAIILAGCAGRDDYGSGVSRPAAVERLTFRLGAIEIVDRTRPAATGPDAVTEFAVPLREAMLEWANGRLAATSGLPGRIRFTATEAKAIREPLEGTPGVRGWFTRDQAERVTVTVSGQIEAVQNDGRLIASATARSEGFRTFVEKIKPEERRNGLNALQKEVLKAFGSELERQVRAEMPSLLQ